jgi:hypothetical protein
MQSLTLTLSPSQAAHYIRSYSYDILHGNTADTFIIDTLRNFVSSIDDNEIVINILYILLNDYAKELLKLSDEDKDSSLYYNLSDFVQFHHIFSSLNTTYKDDYMLSKMLTILSERAHLEENENIISWLQFYNV